MYSNLLGNVSGATKATISLDAAHWAVDLAKKWSYVQVRPKIPYKTYQYNMRNKELGSIVRKKVRLIFLNKR